MEYQSAERARVASDVTAHLSANGAPPFKNVQPNGHLGRRTAAAATLALMMGQLTRINNISPIGKMRRARRCLMSSHVRPSSSVVRLMDATGEKAYLSDVVVASWSTESMLLSAGQGQQFMACPRVWRRCPPHTCEEGCVSVSD